MGIGNNMIVGIARTNNHPAVLTHSQNQTILLSKISRPREDCRNENVATICLNFASFLFFKNKVLWATNKHEELEGRIRNLKVPLFHFLVCCKVKLTDNLSI